MTKRVKCNVCGGFGSKIPERHGGMVVPVECKHCNGTGRIEVPMTNADRIRAMSDQELAEFICGMVENCYETHCPGAGLCVAGDGKSNGMKKWLQQPVKEE